MSVRGSVAGPAFPQFVPYGGEVEIATGTANTTRTASSQRRQEELANLAQNLGLGDDLIGNAQGVPDIHQASLGTVVNRGSALNARDTQGKYMGWETFQNANQGYFNTKQQVLLTPQWANYLNSLVPEYQQQAANVDADNFSWGLGGIVDGIEPPNGGFYFPQVTQYDYDDRARLLVGGDQVAGTPSVVLPGSSIGTIARNRGYAVGLVKVKNPSKSTGYPQVGSQRWRTIIAEYVESGGTTAGEEDIQHFIGQGGVYALGPVFLRNGLSVGIVPQTGEGNIPVRYYLQNAADGRPISVAEALARAPNLMRDVETYYDENLVNPDQRRTGTYANVALWLRHADKLEIYPNAVNGLQQPATTVEDVSQAINDAWQQGIPIGELGLQWKNEYRDFNDRRGITAFPLRTLDGEPIQRATSDRAGGCNLYGSGPGVFESASLGGQGGFRLYAGTRPHYSKARGAQGTPLGPGRTMYCQPTKNFVINPNRNIYDRGAKRGTSQYSLAEGLNAIAADPNASEYMQQFTPAWLENNYEDWATNPAQYGTDPAFMLDPASGRMGFSVAAPQYWASQLTPEEQAAFNRTNLTQAFKAAQSNQALTRLTGQQIGFGGQNFGAEQLGPK